MIRWKLFIFLFLFPGKTGSQSVSTRRKAYHSHGQIIEKEKKFIRIKCNFISSYAVINHYFFAVIAKFYESRLLTKKLKH